jgi:hypothetical protein
MKKVTVLREDEDPLVDEYERSKQESKPTYIANVVLIVILIIALLTGLGFTGGWIYELVKFNQSQSDIQDTYNKIQAVQREIALASQRLNKCQTHDCPIPLCYSCCPLCTNYSASLLVFGNSTLIPPGQTTTSPSDFTNFGNINATTYLERNFTLLNNHTTNTLKVLGRATTAGPGISFVYIGAGSGFSNNINQQFFISPNASSIVTVRFTAGSSTTVTTAVFQIASSDPLVPLYTFYLRATTV